MSIRTPSTGYEPTPWLPITIAVAFLLAIFVWVYARFAGSLYFGMDDYILAEVILARPLGEVLWGFFSGGLTWSGYRPVSTGFQALLLHLFGMQPMTPYYVVGMALHLANTLLLFHLVWRVARHILPAFLAATFFLLLPAHNEAVLVMSFNLNPLALCLALVAMECALTLSLAERSETQVREWQHVLLVAGASVAYLLAILAYEVTLPLVFLVLLADWLIVAVKIPSLRSGFLRRRSALYVALFAAAAISLVLRWWASSGTFVPDRADYGTSFAPAHLLKGYTQLFSQILLLFNSPWLHLPDYVYTREWMAPTNPRALVSIGLVGAATVITLWLALRHSRPGIAGRAALGWTVWGALWMLSISLPFVALAGRNPENRYTYIPSVGAAVIFAVLFTWLFALLAKRSWHRIGTIVLTLVAAGWLGVYAWVTTSDVAEFTRAGAHARAFLSAVDTLPIADFSTVAEVGVPFDVGSAYVFSTGDAFEAALRLHGANSDATILAGDLAVSALSADLSDTTGITLLIGYDRIDHVAQPVARALLCVDAGAPATCQPVAFAGLPVTGAPWGYVQVYNDADGLDGGIGMLVAAQEGAPMLESCWQFHDLSRFAPNPASFDSAAVAARCQETFAMLVPRLPTLFAETP